MPTYLPVYLRSYPPACPALPCPTGCSPLVRKAPCKIRETSLPPEPSSFLGRGGTELGQEDVNTASGQTEDNRFPTGPFRKKVDDSLSNRQVIPAASHEAVKECHPLPVYRYRFRVGLSLSSCVSSSRRWGWLRREDRQARAIWG